MQELAEAGVRVLNAQAVEFAKEKGIASLVLSLENLHDFQGLRAAIGGRASLREGVGAVSAIGTGINATFRNVRTALETIHELGAPLLGLSTSSFRISALVPEAATDETVCRLHERLVEAEPVL